MSAACLSGARLRCGVTSWRLALAKRPPCAWPRAIAKAARPASALEPESPHALLCPPLKPAAGADLSSVTRPDFPVLRQSANGMLLVYLDNATTAPKPQVVSEAVQAYNEHYTSNVHRGVHALGIRATTEFEAARHKVAAFLGAGSPQEIVFTRNATEAINLVACSWGAANLKPGDEVVLSVAEHHSNLVPWQLLAQRTTGLVLKFADLTPTEEIDIDHLARLVTPRTRLVSLVHVSNMLGCVLPVERAAEIAHSVGAQLLLDCCQSVPNIPVNAQELGVDFIAASGHKMGGPTGIGFLWARADLLQGMPPWMGGGEMIQDVHLESATYADPPQRFEAGTPAIAEAIGLGAACDYLSGLGMGRVAAHKQELGAYMYEKLRRLNTVRIYGPPPDVPMGRAALTTFNVEGLSPLDIATFLDQHGGIAVRAGHLCTLPVHYRLGISQSVRASAYVYTSAAEIDYFIETLQEAIKRLAQH